MWIQMWVLERNYAGVPGRGSVDAWREVPSTLEDNKLEDRSYCGGVAGIAKFFDQTKRAMLYQVAAAAGMPTGVLTAYKAYLEALPMYNVLAGGIGAPHKRLCVIPQGCSLSMAVVALIMRPWIIQMRTVGDSRCFILAGDVLILAQGQHMLGQFAKALHTTHDFLQQMGAKVAPNKSFSFVSGRTAAVWLRQTTWDYIDATIEVVTDLRYLGAHLTTRQKPSSATLEARWEKGTNQLKRLRYCPAATEAKVAIILAKTDAATLYGVGAAKVQPQKVARLAAAVIDVFKPKNNHRNADSLFATLSTDEAKYLDPVVQILGMRAMQIRRSASKGRDAETRFKNILMTYVRIHSEGTPNPTGSLLVVGGEWPKWFHDLDSGKVKLPSTYPVPQPLPPTKEQAADWDHQIQPIGPVGLLIESIV